LHRDDGGDEHRGIDYRQPAADVHLERGLFDSGTLAPADGGGGVYAGAVAAQSSRGTRRSSIDGGADGRAVSGGDVRRIFRRGDGSADDVALSGRVRDVSAYGGRAANGVRGGDQYSGGDDFRVERRARLQGRHSDAGSGYCGRVCGRAGGEEIERGKRAARDSRL